MTAIKKTTWGGKRRGAGPKSRKKILIEIGKILPPKFAELAAERLDSSGWTDDIVVISLRDYAKLIREASVK